MSSATGLHTISSIPLGLNRKEKNTNADRAREKIIKGDVNWDKTIIAEQVLNNVVQRPL
jgi:hypothetical protein